MGDRESGRSRDLDELRRTLFPELSPEQGWAEIDRAFERSGDDERWARIEHYASEHDLLEALLRRVRESRLDEPT